ncbi:hypothetical protein [Gorillibacterium timonense]|uniref:hypothetical protein n=1 Tax=Gorillibacterium timonense TaxID=1689269 RepID=UPI00071DB0E8|nr:hypothetical protein [Gorillibacterium timonense]
MKQYFIHADMFDEDYQQLYVREENAVQTETAYELVREETRSVLLVPKSSCLEITEEEYGRLRSLGEGSSVFGREAFAVITSKLEKELQSI